MLASGVAAYLTKPLDLAELGRLVHSFRTKGDSTRSRDDTTMSHSMLYIDDSVDNLVLVRAHSPAPRGRPAPRGQNRQDGIAAALGDPPSLILLDNRLPDSSGMQVLLQLAAGASGFLAKPFAVGELLAIVARHLG